MERRAFVPQSIPGYGLQKTKMGDDAFSRRRPFFMRRMPFCDLTHAKPESLGFTV